MVRAPPERIHDDAPARKADLMQLEQIAASYPSRERFLTELTLDPPDATSDEAGAAQRDEDYLILSTIHSAKGQEWSAVFLLNAVDGCIPSDLAAGETEEIEEERRLLYVAMTRRSTSSTSLCRSASTSTSNRVAATGGSRPRRRLIFRCQARSVPQAWHRRKASSARRSSRALAT
jgi:superfamily I DNA/RNA helicase